MFMPVRNFVNMYIHVCTMYGDACTDLPILVQVVRIPDGVSPNWPVHESDQICQAQPLPLPTYDIVRQTYRDQQIKV